MVNSVLSISVIKNLHHSQPSAQDHLDQSQIKIG